MSTSLRITEAFPAPSPNTALLSQRFRDAYAELITAAHELEDANAHRNYCDGCNGVHLGRGNRASFEHAPHCRIARIIAAVHQVQSIVPHVSSELLLCCRLGTHSKCEGSEEAVLPGGPTWRRECSCACHKEQA